MRFGIVGYSTRALVEAVVSQGHSAIAFDAFGDQDTVDLADQCYVISNWPDEILPIAQPVEVDAWLLAGGMENHPQVVAALSHRAPVLGASADQLLTLRAPEFWSAITQDIDGLAWPGMWPRLPACESRDEDTREIDDQNRGHRLEAYATTRLEAYATPRRWLFKQRLGAGGLHVRAEGDAARGTGDGYWQPYIQGRALGVTFIVHADEVSLLGVTQSLSADQWPGPTAFIYRGSCGPIGMTNSQNAAALAMAQRVASALPGYRGWLQADFIEDASGRLWLLELNPRWTAGMEVLHACLPPAHSPVTEHLRCFGLTTATSQREAVRPKSFLKAIVYADSARVLSQTTRQRLSGMRNWQRLPGLPIELSLADLPQVNGSDPVTFECGSPILTVRLRRF